MNLWPKPSSSQQPLHCPSPPLRSNNMIHFHICHMDSSPTTIHHRPPTALRLICGTLLKFDCLPFECAKVRSWASSFIVCESGYSLVVDGGWLKLGWYYVYVMCSLPFNLADDFHSGSTNFNRKQTQLKFVIRKHTLEWE